MSQLVHIFYHFLQLWSKFYILYTFQNMQNFIYFTKISRIIQNACYILSSTDLKKIEKDISHKRRLHIHILRVVATKFRTVSTRSCIWLAEWRSKILIFVCWRWAFSLFASLHLSVFTQDLHQTSHSLSFSVRRVSSVLDHLIGLLISKAVAFNRSLCDFPEHMEVKMSRMSSLLATFFKRSMVQSAGS